MKNPFVNWAPSIGSSSGNIGSSNTNSIFNMPNMNISSRAPGNLGSDYNFPNDSVKITKISIY